MTFGVSRDNGAFEWSGTSLGAIFAQWTNFFSPRMWRMIFDIVRFNQFALDLLHNEDESEHAPSGTTNGHMNGTTKSEVKKIHDKPRSLESIGSYLERGGYSDAFSQDYLIPMTAAVWSTSPEKCALDFPAMTLVRFMWNHHLLTTVAARPSWMTIPGGSQQYIDAVMKDFPASNVHLRTHVAGVEDINDKVILQFDDVNKGEELFDHVILACHGDQALDIIRDGGTQEERDILAGFQTTVNTAVLHSDLSLMPRRRAAWSAWNLMTRSLHDVARTTEGEEAKDDAVCLTYNMNILQHLPVSEVGDVLVTLNPVESPNPQTVQGTWTYHHPLYNERMIQSQKALPSIQNTRNISYCGAWTKYGFHEDGFSSGLKVAMEHLDAKLPFEFTDSTFSRGRRPQFGYADYLVRLIVWYLLLWIRPTELVWAVLTRFFVLKRGKDRQSNGQSKKLQ